MPCGELIACFQCGKDLSKASEFAKALRLNIKVADLYTSITDISQENLLNGQMYNLYNDLNLDICCRDSINTYTDKTDQVYIKDINFIEEKK